MAKSFFSRRSPAGMAAMADAVDHLRQDVHRAGNQYSQVTREAGEALLILALALYIVENYEEAEPTFVRYIEVGKEKLGPNTLEVFHSLGILAEVYFCLNRLPEGIGLVNEAKSISKKIDPCAYDPMVETLFRRAAAYNGTTDLTSRQREFVVALMALSLCITRGLHRSSVGARIPDGLRGIFTSYGMDHEYWE